MDYVKKIREFRNLTDYSQRWLSRHIVFMHKMHHHIRERTKIDGTQVHGYFLRFRAYRAMFFVLLDSRAIWAFPCTQPDHEMDRIDVPT